MEIDFVKSDNIIETLLSKIYFFGSKVYKFYKWKEAFYGDLSNPDFRRKFIEEDFLWNRIMSPDIYKELTVLKNENGKEDLCIIMEKLKGNKNFINCVEENNLSSEILKNFSKNLFENQRKITDLKNNELSGFLSEDLKKIEIREIEDLKNWCYMAEENLPRETTDEFAKKLFQVLETPDYLNWRKAARKSACIDGNGDNFIFQDGEIIFIDILPPKMDWRVKDEIFNLSRAVADIRALGENKSLADEIYKNYEEMAGVRVPEKIKMLYETRGALIQAAYRYILNQPKRAERYLNFAEATLKIL